MSYKYTPVAPPIQIDTFTSCLGEQPPPTTGSYIYRPPKDGYPAEWYIVEADPAADAARLKAAEANLRRAQEEVDRLRRGAK